MLYPIKKAVQKGQPFFTGVILNAFLSFPSNRESKKTLGIMYSHFRGNDKS